jgi:ubiquinone/menaquinone biosynthesis C-methylase UbiE
VRGLPDLGSRSTEPELLDQGVSESEARRSLGDLRFANRWLGGRRGLLAATRPHVAGGGRLLDVGCASADLPAFLCERIGAPVLAVGVDIKVLHVRDAAPEVRVVVADVHALPFPDRAFDVVTASHFLHHFDGKDLVAVLRGLLRLARRALVVSELHRAQVPHLFGRVFFPLLFESPVSVSDGLASIRRGFRPGELRAALDDAGATSVSVRRCFPYRLLAVARGDDEGPMTTRGGP